MTSRRKGRGDAGVPFQYIEEPMTQPTKRPFDLEKEYMRISNLQ
jgi:hypothetical protein